MQPIKALAATLAALAFPTAAMAQPEIVSDSGDTAWILVSSAFVLLMTIPGLGLFYGGLVRSRNILSVVMHCIAITCAVSLLWVICGYSLVFGENNTGLGGYIGGSGNFMLGNLADLRDGYTVPESSYALFQMTFAMITPALVVGAFVERVRFGWMITFSLLWTLLVYVPVARWMWGGGWLSGMGALDFAGGIVVHTTAGVAALIIAKMLGARKGFNKSLLPPNSAALTMVGGGLLWVGWFGFNGGSTLGAADSAATTIINTHIAACTAALAWILIERIRIGKPTGIGIVTGAIAGLATVTPAADFIGPMGAILLGFIGSTVCFFSVQLVKQKLGIDDSLDVFAVHGVGGITGSLLMPLFFIESLGGGGFADGNTMANQLVAQLVAVVAVVLWTAIMTVILALAISMVLPMRVTEEEEHDGLDISSHGERGWELD
jgi:ammonium transporter, Amt family